MDNDVLEFEILRGRITPKVRMTARPVRPGVGFVDQLSFTFLDNFHHSPELKSLVSRAGGIGRTMLDCREVIEHQVAPLVGWVFGVRLGEKRAAGLNFYRETWELQDGRGMVSIGGQAGTILVQITGQGMACAPSGWQERLKELAGTVQRFTITRLDAAFDDVDGRFSVDAAVEAYHRGEFTLRGRPPSVEQRGNWLAPDGKGRTFYVGSRSNGKLLRVYEKGKQLGDSASPWVRIECEWHNKDRVIPLEAVLCPGAYLAGAYTALEWIAGVEGVSRIATLTKAAKITYEAMLAHLRRAYGGLLGVVRAVEPDVDAALDRLTVGRRVPGRLDRALMPLAVPV